MSSREQAKLVIYLITKGRVDHQFTLRSLPREWHKRVIIVCPADEAKAHKRNWPKCRVVVQGKEVKSMSSCRVWVFKHAQKHGYEKIVMTDDDLRFAARKVIKKSLRGFGKLEPGKWNEYVEKNPDLARLVNLPDEDPKIGAMLQAMEDMLNVYAHGGLHARLMSNQNAYEWKLNTRIQQFFAFHVPTVMKHCVLGRIEYREDFDYELQLLRAGFDAAVYCWLVCEQARGFQAKGGESTTRSLKRVNATAYQLAKFHPGLVKVVDRVYNRNSRKEVIIYWQKAALEGQAKEFL